MNKKQFTQYLDPRLQDKISHIASTSFNKKDITYGVIKTEWIPQELRNTGIIGSLLEIISPGITKGQILLSLPENQSYQELIKYIALEEYFKSKIVKPERDFKSINEILINTIETEIMHTLLSGVYKKEKKDRIKENLTHFHSDIIQHEITLRDKRRSTTKNLISIFQQ